MARLICLGKQSTPKCAEYTGVSLATSPSPTPPWSSPDVEEGSGYAAASIKPSWMAFSWSAWTEHQFNKKPSRSQRTPAILDIPRSLT